MDVFTPLKRSVIMSRIRSIGNRETEVAFALRLRREGIAGWRRRVALYGKPDFIFPRERVAVFIDGCFWHHCPRHGKIPKAHRAYWRGKIVRNMERAKEVNRELRRQKWAVVRVWGCELGNKQRLKRKLQRLRALLGI